MFSIHIFSVLYPESGLSTLLRKLFTSEHLNQDGKEFPLKLDNSITSSNKQKQSLGNAKSATIFHFSVVFPVSSTRMTHIWDQR